MRYKYCVRHNRRHYCLRTRVASSPLNRRMQPSRGMRPNQPDTPAIPDTAGKFIRETATASLGAGAYPAYKSFLRGGRTRAVSQYYWDPKTQGYKKVSRSKYLTNKKTYRQYSRGGRAPSATRGATKYPRSISRFSLYRGGRGGGGYRVPGIRIYN